MVLPCVLLSSHFVGCQVRASIITSETTNSATLTHCKIVTFRFEPRHELKTVFGYGLLCACIMCPMAVAGDV